MFGYVQQSRNAMVPRLCERRRDGEKWGYDAVYARFLERRDARSFITVSHVAKACLLTYGRFP